MIGWLFCQQKWLYIPYIWLNWKHPHTSSVSLVKCEYSYMLVCVHFSVVQVPRELHLPSEAKYCIFVNFNSPHSHVWRYNFSVSADSSPWQRHPHGGGWAASCKNLLFRPAIPLGHGPGWPTVDRVPSGSNVSRWQWQRWCGCPSKWWLLTGVLVFRGYTPFCLQCPKPGEVSLLCGLDTHFGISGAGKSCPEPRWVTLFWVSQRNLSGSRIAERIVPHIVTAF